jgi:CBS domain-containing protein
MEAAMLAKDIMTSNVITVAPQTPVKNLARILTKNHISGVPVLDRKGKLLGIVSEADLIAKRGRLAKSIMSHHVTSVTEETPVEEIAKVLTTHKIKRVPVSRGEKLVGIVSRGDIVRALAMGEHMAMVTPIYDL